MDAFDLSELMATRYPAGQPYREFFRRPGLSLGLYRLPVSALDLQQPHTEDEVYYVLRGRGFVRVGSENRGVQAGTLLFVGTGVEHRFHSIEEELVLLVVFAPAEGARAAAAKEAG